MTHDGSVRDELLRSHDEYRKLHDQHHEYEARLAGFADKVVLTEDEQVEEITLKKKKLALKDRMEEIVRATRETAAHP